jgi:hypothetical protein
LFLAGRKLRGDRWRQPQPSAKPPRS